MTESEGKLELAEPAHTQPAIMPTTFYGILAEATRFTILVVFILYALGFIIWHAYLAQFAVASSDFLRVEYFSAALCYLIIVATFGIPPALLLSRYIIRRLEKTKAEQATVERQGDNLSLIFYLWFAGSSAWVAVYFPDSSPKEPHAVFIVIAISLILLGLSGVAYLYYGIAKKKGKVFNFMERYDMGYFLLIVLGLVSLLSNPAVSKLFLVVTMALYTGYAGVYYLFSERVGSLSLWMKSSIPMRILQCTLICLFLAMHVQAFGVLQFGQVSKTLGGGRPELARLQLSPQHLDLIASLGLQATNGMASRNGCIGPVAILVKTEKEITFIEASQLDSTNKCAKQIRADLIDGITFLH